MRVGVNLLWLVPGDVGGSEEYITRQLVALRSHCPDIALTLFVVEGFVAAHPGLAASCDVVVAPITGSRRLVRVVAERVWLPRASRRSRVDVMHHAGGTMPAGGRVPSVVTVHDAQYLTFPETFRPIKLRWLRRSVPAAVRRASVVAVPSRFVAESLTAAYRLDIDRTIVVPNAFVPDPTATTEPEVLRKRYDLGSPVLVYPAITYRHKNHAMLLRAFNRVLTELPGACLVLIGGVGPCEAEVRATAMSLGVWDHVRRPGRVPDADRDGLVGMADALVFPSRYEGFGVPVVEAMALGCPVIAANATALPEAVGDAGILVDPDDVDGWVEAINLVVRDPGVAADLRRRGAVRLASLSPAQSARALESAYRLAYCPTS